MHQTKMSKCSHTGTSQYLTLRNSDY